MPEPTIAVGQTLAKVPIFSGLTEGELNFLAQSAVPHSYSAGQSVFGEGEPCSGLYVVESGHVRIFKSSASGREQVLSIDGPGSSIAELPVFDGGNYPASVTAIDEAKLLFVSKQDFQALCLAHPQVALKVLRVVGSRLRHCRTTVSGSKAGGWLACGSAMQRTQPRLVDERPRSCSTALPIHRRLKTWITNGVPVAAAEKGTAWPEMKTAPDHNEKEQKQTSDQRAVFDFREHDAPPMQLCLAIATAAPSLT